MKTKLSMYARSDSDPENKTGMIIDLVCVQHKFLMADEDIDLGEITIEFDAPSDITSNTLREKAIETLKKKQDSLAAEAYQQHLRLQAKIDKLLFLPQAAPDPDTVPF